MSVFDNYILHDDKKQEDAAASCNVSIQNEDEILQSGEKVHHLFVELFNIHTLDCSYLFNILYYHYFSQFLSGCLF